MMSSPDLHAALRNSFVSIATTTDKNVCAPRIIGFTGTGDLPMPHVMVEEPKGSHKNHSLYARAWRDWNRGQISNKRLVILFNETQRAINCLESFELKQSERALELRDKLSMMLPVVQQRNLQDKCPVSIQF
jgi:hypothetical protein